MTFCGAVVSLKVMDQNFNNAFGEFARHEFTNLSLETLPDTLSLSLTGIRLSQCYIPLLKLYILLFSCFVMREDVYVTNTRQRKNSWFAWWQCWVVNTITIIFLKNLHENGV